MPRFFYFGENIMSSAAQIAANRANALHSTGPRTEEGKAKTSRNATRHGLCAGIALMADESEAKAEFEQLHADLREEHQPVGPTEDILVYKMAENFFAANRAQVLLAERLDFNDHEDDSKQVSLMLRYHTTADRGFYRALNELRKLQKDRRNNEIGSVSQPPETTPAEPPNQPAIEVKTDASRSNLPPSPVPTSPRPVQNPPEVAKKAA
jgi:hypothetical protein